jgi:hypothetical protein
MPSSHAALLRSWRAAVAADVAAAVTDEDNSGDDAADDVDNVLHAPPPAAVVPPPPPPAAAVVVAAVPAAAPPPPVLKKCCICLSDVLLDELFILLPCLHRCVCARCADVLLKERLRCYRLCPKCRAPVERAGRVYED